MGAGKHLAGAMCPDEHALEREHEAGQQHRRKQDELHHLDGVHPIARLRVERHPKNEVGSSEQIVFNDAIYRTDAVLPADFLPFLIPGFAVARQTAEISAIFQWLVTDGFRACVYAVAAACGGSSTARSCLGADTPRFFSVEASSAGIFVR